MVRFSEVFGYIVQTPINTESSNEDIVQTPINTESSNEDIHNPIIIHMTIDQIIAIKHKPLQNNISYNKITNYSIKNGDGNILFSRGDITRDTDYTEIIKILWNNTPWETTYATTFYRLRSTNNKPSRADLFKDCYDKNAAYALKEICNLIKANGYTINICIGSGTDTKYIIN
jgi:hypothetical protein